MRKKVDKKVFIKLKQKASNYSASEKNLTQLVGKNCRKQWSERDWVTKNTVFNKG